MTRIDYDAARREMPKLKAALTRAKNGGDPVKVLAAIEQALDAFDRWGAWPDQWATWKVALDDAFWTFSRSDAYDDDVYDNGGQLVGRFHRAFDRFF